MLVASQEPCKRGAIPAFSGGRTEAQSSQVASDTGARVSRPSAVGSVTVRAGPSPWALASSPGFMWLIPAWEGGTRLPSQRGPRGVRSRRSREPGVQPLSAGGSWGVWLQNLCPPEPSGVLKGGSWWPPGEHLAVRPRVASSLCRPSVSLLWADERTRRGKEHQVPLGRVLGDAQRAARHAGGASGKGAGVCSFTGEVGEGGTEGSTGLKGRALAFCHSHCGPRPVVPASPGSSESAAASQTCWLGKRVLASAQGLCVRARCSGWQQRRTISALPLPPGLPQLLSRCLPHRTSTVH